MYAEMHPNGVLKLPKMAKAVPGLKIQEILPEHDVSLRS
jgi:hypothetical protein